MGAARYRPAPAASSTADARAGDRGAGAGSSSGRRGGRPHRRRGARPAGGFTFCHALVRETLYAPPGRVAAACAATANVGEALERPAAPRPRPTGAATSSRRARCAGTDRAIEQSRRRGPEAAETLAYEEAAEHHGRCARSEPDAPTPSRGAARCSSRSAASVACGLPQRPGAAMREAPPSALAAARPRQLARAALGIRAVLGGGRRERRPPVSRGGAGAARAEPSSCGRACSPAARRGPALHRRAFEGARNSSAAIAMAPSCRAGPHGRPGARDAVGARERAGRAPRRAAGHRPPRRAARIAGEAQLDRRAAREMRARACTGGSSTCRAGPGGGGATPLRSSRAGRRPPQPVYHHLAPPGRAFRAARRHADEAERRADAHAEWAGARARPRRAARPTRCWSRSAATRAGPASSWSSVRGVSPSTPIATSLARRAAVARLEAGTPEEARAELRAATPTRFARCPATSSGLTTVR